MAILGMIAPKGIQVQIKDTISNKSKSFTVHGISFEKLFYRLLFYSQKLTEFKQIRLVCKKESKNDEVSE